MTGRVSDDRPPRASKAIVVLVVALVLAALARPHTALGLCIAYLVAWAGIEVLARTRFSERALALPWPVWLAMAVVPAAVLVRDGATLLANEGLRHVDARLVDRAPSLLDPSHLRTDGPQAFLVWAPRVEHVALELGGATFEGEALGAGVFRIDVDPADLTLEGESVIANVLLDGASHRERLRVIHALPHPRHLVRDATGRAACALSEETDELYRIDEAGLTRTTVGDRPVACAFEGDRVWVATRSGTLEAWEQGARVEVMAGDGEVVAMAMHALGPALLARVAAHEGLASEVRFGDATLTLEGIADHLAFLELLSGPALVVALRAPARLVVIALPSTDQELGRLASDALRSRGEAPLRFGASAPSTPDQPSLRVIRERPLRAPAIALATRGPFVVIATTDFDDDPTPHLGNHFIDDQLVRFDETLAVQQVLHTAGRTPAQDHAGDVDIGAGPRGLSFDGGDLLISFEGSREVVRAASFSAPLERHGLGALDDEAHAPESAVRLEDGTLLIASPASGSILSVRGDVVRIERLAPSAGELLREAPEALRIRMGELAFGEATRSGVSCASCHLFAGSDYVAHNIGGRVLAPTLDVRGIGGTAPYLRDGSYPRLADLHDVALEEYRGYRLRAGDRGATIEGYLAASSRPALHTAPDQAAVQRGAEVFERAECVHCHVPPTFTDLGLHAGVALFPDHRFPANVVALDTPSLRGVAESPPYLYDGRARTLRELLTRENRADRHGHTADLSETDIDDLIAFLEALP